MRLTVCSPCSPLCLTHASTTGMLIRHHSLALAGPAGLISCQITSHCTNSTAPGVEAEYSGVRVLPGGLKGHAEPSALRCSTVSDSLTLLNPAPR